MTKRWRWLTGLVAVVAIAGTILVFVGMRRHKITVSKETTFFTEPLRPDGYVDYVASLDGLASEDVTPENNAAVLLLQAFGPAEIDASISDWFFETLGVPPIAKEGKYYESFDGFFDRTAPAQETDGLGPGGPDRFRAALDQIEEAMSRPWTEAEFPLLAKWLVENEKPLELVVAASKRPKCYVPLLRESDAATSLTMFCPLLHGPRDAIRGLSARAMLRVKGGKLEEAFQDLLACHRIARLIAQRPAVLVAIIGYGVEGTACTGDAALAHWGRLTPEQAKRYAEQLRSLPPMERIADKVNLGDRAMFLDELASMARGHLKQNDDSQSQQSESGRSVDRLIHSIGRRSLDWNEALRLVNTNFDRAVAALAKSTHRERKAALDELARETESLRKGLARPEGILRRLFSAAHGTAEAHKTALVLASLQAGTLRLAESSETRAETALRMARVAFALAPYRAEHGAYPPELKDLVPKYLDSIPEDPFSGNGLHYKREGTGYLLYSVGPNGQDDDGRESSVRDPKTDQELEGDDVVIRMPVPKKAGP